MGPELIGKYRVERALGAGSFATVWLAHDELLDARVAIKVLADNWARQPDIRRRFIDEAKILRRIDHDSIVRVHAVDELEDGRPYFVMSWADRGTLHDRIQQRRAQGGRFDPLDAVRTTIEIADCLSVVHAFGVVHRDIKPSNVLYRSRPAHHRALAQARGLAAADDQLQLGDFGLAKDITGGSGFTFAAGTPAYMAPEQANATMPVDARADVFSTAAVLFELLTSQPAFSAESLSGVGRARPGATAAALDALGSPLPPGLRDVVEAGLAADPNQRIATALDLVDALEEILAGRAPAVRRPPPVPSPAPPPTQAHLAPPPAAASQTPPSSSMVQSVIGHIGELERRALPPEVRQAVAGARLRLADQLRVGVVGPPELTTPLAWAVAGEIGLPPLGVSVLPPTWLTGGTSEEAQVRLTDGSLRSGAIRRNQGRVELNLYGADPHATALFLTLDTDRLRRRTVIDAVGVPPRAAFEAFDVVVVALPAHVPTGLEVLAAVRAASREVAVGPVRALGVVTDASFRGVVPAEAEAAAAAGGYRDHAGAQELLQQSAAMSLHSAAAALDAALAATATVADAVRISAALATIDDALQSRAEPESRQLRAELAQWRDALRLAYPAIDEMSVLRAELAGRLPLPAPQRDELRRLLSGTDPASRLGLPPASTAESVRDGTRAALDRWRSYRNTGRITVASRDAADTAIAVLERLWTSSQGSAR